jgi:Ca2+-binding RTX toxin-like protein
VAWGSTASDTINGGSGDDRLAGVMATGTTAAAMGAGQIDRLTGLEGADVFVLGDSRGVFYNDRIAGTLGSGDYAMIRDFRSGVDKLQLAAGYSYFYTVSSNNVSLYWDVNNNGRLTSSGSNRDELIAVLSGITSLSGNDLVGG